MSAAAPASEASPDDTDATAPPAGTSAGNPPPWTKGSPIPHPNRALRSSKLAALHARLALPEKLPLQTLARTLVDSSADPHPSFNNANLALIGMNFLTFHTAEWLMCRYPRLPMAILFSAMRAYCGPVTLNDVARQWGVDEAALPGPEVDPGLLQYDASRRSRDIKPWGYERDYAEHSHWRRGMHSRTIMDDDFGDVVSRGEEAEANKKREAEARERRPWELTDEPASPLRYSSVASELAHATFARALIGAIYAHCGRQAGKAFVRAHVLSRQLDLATLFHFQGPTRELLMLCRREGWEDPVARLESETGRLSRTPVFVVGIYTGRDKLGEGVGWSLASARHKAAMNCLKSWYLYSPGKHAPVPSDMLVDRGKKWEPAYIDMGEVMG